MIHLKWCLGLYKCSFFCIDVSINYLIKFFKILKKALTDKILMISSSIDLIAIYDSEIMFIFKSQILISVIKLLFLQLIVFQSD